MAETTAVFLNGSLMRHVCVMAFTASIGLTAVFAVDFVDMVFIAMLGNEALAAAVGYAGTILFFTTSINIGLSISAGSLVARAIGANKLQAARSYATSVVSLGALIGVVVPIGLLLTLPQILDFLGAKGEVATLATRYLVIVLPTMPFFAVAMATSAVLRAYGDARRAMMVTLVGAVVNAALDPLLIFGLNLGLDGAALATAVSRVVMIVVALLPAIRVYAAFAQPQWVNLLRDFSAVIGIALPAVLTNIATPIGNAIITREISQFGTEAIAALAIISRLTLLSFAVLFALSGAIGPIIGQNFGAGQLQRVRSALNAGLLFTAMYVLVVSLILFVLREPIAVLFDAQGLVRELIFLFCGPLALASFFNGVIFISNASFNNLGYPVYSTVINWGRHTLGTWPFAVLGAKWYGAFGVLLGQAIGGIVFTAIAWLMVVRVTSHLQKLQALPNDLEQQGWLHSLLHRRV